MTRWMLCAVFVLVLPAAHADEKQAKKEMTIGGVIKKVDVSAHRLHVTRMGKEVPRELEFAIHDSTRFVFDLDDSKKEFRGKAAYKDRRLAEGASVTLRVEGNKLSEVRVTKAAPSTEK